MQYFVWRLVPCSFPKNPSLPFLVFMARVRQIGIFPYVTYLASFPPLRTNNGIQILMCSDYIHATYWSIKKIMWPISRFYDLVTIFYFVSGSLLLPWIYITFWFRCIIHKSCYAICDPLFPFNRLLYIGCSYGNSIFFQNSLYSSLLQLYLLYREEPTVALLRLNW